MPPRQPSKPKCEICGGVIICNLGCPNHKEDDKITEMWRTQPKPPGSGYDNNDSSSSGSEANSLVERRTPTPTGLAKSGLRTSGSTKTGATVPSRFAESQGGQSGSVDQASESIASGDQATGFRKGRLDIAAMNAAKPAPNLVGPASLASGQSTSGHASKTGGGASAKSYPSMPGGKSGGKSAGPGTGKGSQKK